MRAGLLCFFALLFAEVWSIIKMSEHIGGWATFILLVAGFFFGLQLMRAQGINAMIKASQAAQTSQSPLGPIAEGIVKAFAGILLIIPGFFSDLIALLILLPFVRKGFARHLAKKGQFQGFAMGQGGGFGSFSRFGQRSVNDDFAGGNVYDHDGNAKVDDGQIIEGKVIAVKPNDKSSGEKS